MSYNGKRIKVHKTCSIAGIKIGDIITVQVDPSCAGNGRILSVNGGEYLKTWENHFWALPIYGSGDWEIIGEDEPTVGSIVVLSIGSTKYVGKYKSVAEYGESKYELTDWVGLQYLHTADSFNNGGRFKKFERYATLSEVEQYNKIGQESEPEENTTSFTNGEGKLIRNGDVVQFNSVKGQIYIAKNEKERLIAGSYTRVSKGNIAWILDVQGANNCPILSSGSKAYIIQTYEMDEIKLISPISNKEEYIPKAGDIVILSTNTSVEEGVLYIGEYRYQSKFCITCNPWIIYNNGKMSDAIQTSDGGFHKVERRATDIEIDKFRALVSLSKMKKDRDKDVTSFTNSKGQIVRNGDYVQCVGGKGKIYIAKNAEERALYDHHNESLPVFWVLGINGLDNCPICPGDKAWIVNDNEVTLLKDEEEPISLVDKMTPFVQSDYEQLYNPCKEVDVPYGWKTQIEGIEPKYIVGVDPYIDEYSKKLKFPDLTPKLKHQNPIILRKTKKKRNLVIITK